MARVFGGEIGDEISRTFEQKKGILILDWWHRGPRYLTTTNRKINRVEDLQGLKLRVPELPTYIEAWRIMGTNPTLDGDGTARAFLRLQLRDPCDGQGRRAGTWHETHHLFFRASPPVPAASWRGSGQSPSARARCGAIAMPSRIRVAIA